MPYVLQASDRGGPWSNLGPVVATPPSIAGREYRVVNHDGPGAEVSLVWQGGEWRAPVRKTSKQKLDELIAALHKGELWLPDDTIAWLERARGWPALRTADVERIAHVYANAFEENDRHAR
jgi:hypothetical protein